MGDLVVKGIRRVNEFADPELLEINEAVQLDNAVLDSVGGKAIRRGGFTVFNSNDTSNNMLSLHDITTSAGTNLLLASYSTVLAKSTSGTGAWSNLKTGLTTSLRTRLVPYNGKFIITNGTDGIFITDGTDVWDLEITAPSITGVTTSHAAGGNLTASKEYKYVLVYVTDEGNYSPPSQPFTHYIDTTSNNSTDSTNMQIRFDSLPVSSDTRVVSRLLYRTEGDGTSFYLLKNLNNTDTSFQDSYADTILDTSESPDFLKTPSKADYLAIHNERLFIGNPTLSLKNLIAPAHSGVAGSPPSGWTNGVETAGTGSIL